MKCYYTTQCDLCGHQNEEMCNTCPELGKEMDCPFVNTSGVTMDKECHKCEFYNGGVRPTGATPILGGIINFFRKHV